MAKRLVSVIVPTYNRAYCLTRTIDSVLNQTHQELEVIIVDDGSTDETKDLVQCKYGGERRVIYFYQNNMGVSGARNNGISLAQGDSVAFLDSDDIWRPWKLELQLYCMEFLPHVGMVWTDMEAIDPEGKVYSTKYLRTMYAAYRWFTNNQLFSESYLLREIYPRLNNDVKEAKLYAGDIFSQMIMGNLVHTSTVLIKRDRLNKVKKFNEDLRFTGEDYDFHLRTCREGPVAYIDLSTIQYQTGMPDQLTRPSLKVHMAKNFLKTIEPVIQQDKDRINLPNRMLNATLAMAHAWIGNALIEVGANSEARRYLLKSFWYNPLQYLVILLFLFSYLPTSVRFLLRRKYKRLKMVLRGGN